jgi:sugar phosphate isomerase/epimerase
MVYGGTHAADYIRQILPYGFESFAITFWETTGDNDMVKMADEIKGALAGSEAIVSALNIFCNPLLAGAEGAAAQADWRKCIDAAPLFGCDIVAGFSGRVPDCPIDESIPRYTEVFGELGRYAAERGVRLAFENCHMDGDWKSGSWNIAINPTAWEMMFNAVPLENIGLEWEPCHQMASLIDPLPQLRTWIKKVFHVHGKDATILWDVVREQGIHGPHPFMYHRTPGFGDSNWTDIISILRQGGYVGSIDIEGWHDPVYRDALEMTGQVAGLNYLKRCRGGDFVPNPQ